MLTSGKIENIPDLRSGTLRPNKVSPEYWPWMPHCLESGLLSTFWPIVFMEIYQWVKQAMSWHLSCREAPWTCSAPHALSGGTPQGCLKCFGYRAQAVGQVGALGAAPGSKRIPQRSARALTPAAGGQGVRSGGWGEAGGRGQRTGAGHALTQRGRKGPEEARASLGTEPGPCRARPDRRTPSRAPAPPPPRPPPMKLLPLLGECGRPRSPRLLGPVTCGDPAFPRWKAHAQCAGQVSKERWRNFSGCFSPWPFNSGLRYSGPRDCPFFFFSFLFFPADKILQIPKVSDFDPLSLAPP